MKNIKLKDGFTFKPKRTLKRHSTFDIIFGESEDGQYLFEKHNDSFHRYARISQFSKVLRQITREYLELIDVPELIVDMIKDGDNVLIGYEFRINGIHYRVEAEKAYKQGKPYPKYNVYRNSEKISNIRYRVQVYQLLLLDKTISRHKYKDYSCKSIIA